MQALDDLLDSMIVQKQANPDEVQEIIDDEIFFRYNSVNLVIGKRGSGKTYTTLREILKLPLTGHREYTQVHYVTDKARDDTVDKFRDAFARNHLYFNWVPTKNAEKLIVSLAKAKAMKRDEQSDDDYRALCKALSSDPLSDSDDEDNSDYIKNKAALPHTIIIFDDCIGLFKKDSSLSKKLFENRQSRITYFLLLQDVTGLSASMKANIDSVTFFGGFPQHKYNVLMYQLPPVDVDYNFYSQLNPHEYIRIDFIDGTVECSTNESS